MPEVRNLKLNGNVRDKLEITMVIMFDYISWFTEWRNFNDLLKIMAYVVLFLQRFSNTFEFQNKNNIIDFSNLVICSNSWLYPKFDLANCGRSIDTYYSQFFFYIKYDFQYFLTSLYMWLLLNHWISYGLH